MGDLSEVKIGDVLFVVGGSDDRGRLEKVERLTPSGRVITKVGQYEPNGRMRGQRGWLSRWARPATDADKLALHRQAVVYKLSRFHWGTLDAVDLNTVELIIRRYALPQVTESGGTEQTNSRETKKP